MVEGLVVWKMRLELDDRSGIDGSRRTVQCCWRRREVKAESFGGPSSEGLDVVTSQAGIVRVLCCPFPETVTPKSRGIFPGAVELRDNRTLEGGCGERPGRERKQGSS
jgi:hypothetical protein